MRLPRTSLLARLTDADAPWFVVIEAPTGFGKSWLLRKAAAPGAIRVRGELGPIADDACEPDASIIIDDAHLLNADDVERLVEFVEEAPPTTRLIVSGRILADAIHDVAHLVDGLILDASVLAIGPDEIVEELAAQSEPHADRLVDVSGGCIKLIASAVQQARLDAKDDAVGIASKLVRAWAATALQALDATDSGLVGLIARAPGLDRNLLHALGGPGFVERAVDAGVPLRRQVSGGIDLVCESAFRIVDVDQALAGRVATALLDRGRALDAVGLLVDGGLHERAARVLVDLPESTTKTVEPRTMLAMLARLGTMTDRDPALLLLRAGASAVIGRVDLAGADVESALAQVNSVEPALRRRVSVEAAEWFLHQGRRDEAVAIAESAIRDVGPAEDRTFARAHTVLADAASASVRRADLQRAAEWYRVAAAAWEGCGELARARFCRCDLATAVLQPLGRFDEALAQIAAILAAPDLSDSERSWMLLNEAFLLLGTNRLDSAESRFVRVAELGYLHDNPRTIACAAWGQAMVAARRDDVATSLRWFGTAENTAIGMDDDVLGLPFECDAATTLGALGEMELAERHLAAAHRRGSVFPEMVGLATYIFDARRGVRGDVEAQLELTPPSEWWRVLLLSALAAARDGEPDRAQHLLIEAERELITLGLSDFPALGERRAYEELRATLRRAPVAVEAAPAATVEAPPAAQPQARPARADGRHLRVIGGPMTLEAEGVTQDLPPGNPQRLVGVVVANGGFASFDNISEAIWPGDEMEASRARLRNVLLRLRRGAGDIVVRAGSGVRVAPDVTCDLYEFERLAADASSVARTDPDLAGRLARDAVQVADGPIFGEFEYEEWAIGVRRSVDQKLIGMLDLLSVQAEDAGDLPLAQSLAERALRLDRYSDSRYVRLAELLTLQGRTAAAVAVLEDAAAASREIGGAVPAQVKARRDELLRRAAND